jgi:hypothetical protein
MDAFVRDEVEPLELVLGDPYDKSDKRALAIAKPLQAQVKERGCGRATSAKSSAARASASSSSR